MSMKTRTYPYLLTVIVFTLMDILVIFLLLVSIKIKMEGLNAIIPGIALASSLGFMSAPSTNDERQGKASLE